MVLPKYVAIQSLSNKNYLRPTGLNGMLKFDASSVDSEGLKHEVVTSTAQSGLIHIKCVSTGKYWNCGLTGSPYYMVAEASQPGEDATTRACTLIKHSRTTKDGVCVINLQCLYLGTWYPIRRNLEGYLGGPASAAEDFIISDWELVSPKQPEMVLPKYVAIQSLSNKNYLRPTGLNGMLKFDASSVDSEGVKHEVVTSTAQPGLIHIKCVSTGKYWNCGLTGSPYYMVAEASQPGEDATTRACTLIKHSRSTKDSVCVINLQCLFLGTWYPIRRNSEGYLGGPASAAEDFIISDWELVSPKQPEMVLPKYVAIRSLSNKNYLRPTGLNGMLKFDASSVDSEGVKHEVVTSTAQPGLIHIKCFSTGKYWNCSLTGSPYYMVAEASQPGEDATTRACTLIKHSRSTKDGVCVINLQCLYLGTWYPIRRNSEGYLGGPASAAEDFIISDWELVSPKQPEMVLPKYVAIQSLSNKNYLRPTGLNGMLKFDASSVDSEGVKHEVVTSTTQPGLIHIKCVSTGKYWNCGLTGSSYYMVAEASQPGEDATTRACTLIKHSRSTKDGVCVINLQCLYLGTWYPIRRSSEGYLGGPASAAEDFIISDWELVSPKQPQEPFDGGKNTSTGGGVSSTGNTSTGGGPSILNLTTMFRK